VGHAQILVGEADSVRAHANAIAKELNCLGSEQGTFCGACLSCRVFESNNHPDTFYMQKTKQTGIGVDDVRNQIIEPMSTKPFRYKYKVFIIDKADTLTPAAQSALLKTIEEPAPYGFFLFLAPHLHNFLPTILSRCHVVKVANTATVACNPELQAFAAKLVDSLENLDTLGAFLKYRMFEPYKEKETLYELLDIMYMQYGSKISQAVKVGLAPRQGWLKATSIITDTKNVLSQNGNVQLAIELMLARLSVEKEQDKR